MKKTASLALSIFAVTNALTQSTFHGNFQRTGVSVTPRAHDRQGLVR